MSTIEKLWKRFLKVFPSIVVISGVTVGVIGFIILLVHATPRVEAQIVPADDGSSWLTVQIFNPLPWDISYDLAIRTEQGPVKMVGTVDAFSIASYSGQFQGHIGEVTITGSLGTKTIRQSLR
jgi:hypothetical protein